MIVLAGDIGGTNIRLALVRFDAENTFPQLIDERRFASASVSSLGSAIRSYLQVTKAQIDAAGFGVAAPINAGECRGPNLPWSFNAKELATAAALPRTTLVNDFTALGAGIPYIPASELLTLQQGNPIHHGPIALIGAGTGLGEGFLTWNGNRYMAHASEGGHVTFASRTEREWNLSRYLSTQFGHVSYERVVSGAGLQAIYRYFIDVEQFPESDSVIAAMRHHDPAAIITQHATADSDAACVAAVELFLTVYGAQAGNLALTTLATGGVYVAGGIIAHMKERLQTGSFLQAFCNKGRMHTVLQDIPVHVIISSTAALFGAAVLALNPSNGVA